jgi:hypothetical protein
MERRSEEKELTFQPLSFDVGSSKLEVQSSTTTLPGGGHRSPLIDD